MAVSTTTTSTLKTGTGNGTSGAATEPSGTTSGDMLIAIVGIEGAASGLTRPTGWTNLANGTSAESVFDYDISYISRGGSAPSLTWTWTGNVYYEVHILKVTTTDAGTVTLDAQSSVTAPFSGTPDPPSVTVATANSLVASFTMDWAGSGGSGWGAPTNYTIRSTNTAGLDGCMIARTALVAAGSEDPGALTGDGDTGGNYIAMTLAFNQTAGGGGGRTTKNTRSAPLGMEVGMNWRGGGL